MIYLHIYAIICQLVGAGYIGWRLGKLLTWVMSWPWRNPKFRAHLRAGVKLIPAAIKVELIYAKNYWPDRLLGRTVGQHKHKCSSCAHIWSHNDRKIISGIAYLSAHDCPACGKPEFKVFNPRKGKHDKLLESIESLHTL